MEMIIRQADFLELSYDDSHGNTGDNGDRYTFSLSSPGGQNFYINGKEVAHVEFTIVGNLELNEFFEAIKIVDQSRRRY